MRITGLFLVGAMCASAQSPQLRLAGLAPEAASPVLFYHAGAAMYDGPGALSPATRREMAEYLRKTYFNYHGEDAGLVESEALAKSRPSPPAGFLVKPFSQVVIERPPTSEDDSRRLAFQVGQWERNDTALPEVPEIGSEIEFHGVANAFMREPFMLTCKVQRAQLKIHAH